ncbi:septal ring lytic transglycosylase RlpA family protein [Rhizobium sp. GN54]|uniref:septal ring lytic transglycosylase RlpA family protein n=1 Tax=Rhizobium sp. GN54 TaxID=2898150 RepID=UPI001E5C779A|nr:septal ring lytic transglycosylase RlpA family protein [Rhizobium sp. GN54]MCD2184735.1 septal ring lytic transglycosylase RlpA family protein [Rhizobium sp. GN54]
MEEKMQRPRIAALVATFVFLPVGAEANHGCGRASWYALTSKTASGERMDPTQLTAAHKTMKLGTKIEVTSSETGKSVVVRVNDRGPFVRGRVLDLSKAAAMEIGMISAGHARVCFDDVKDAAWHPLLRQSVRARPIW